MNSNALPLKNIYGSQQWNNQVIFEIIPKNTVTQEQFLQMRIKDVGWESQVGKSAAERTLKLRSKQYVTYERF